MLSGNKTIVLIQESGRDGLAFGTVKSDGVAVINLNGIDAFIRADCAIDLHMSACSMGSGKFVMGARRASIFTLKAVGLLKDNRRENVGAHLERINDVCVLGRRYAEKDKGRYRFQTQMNAHCSTPL